MNELYKVLIVEDDPYIMKLCSIFLTDENYSVLSAETGTEALKIFNEKHPHLILLDLGTDDYISKPFHTGELMARIRAARRRISPPQAPSPDKYLFTCGDLQVDFSEEKVTVSGSVIHLTPIEFKLLRLLIKNQGKVLTHSYILSKVWQDDDPKNAQNLRVFMANLRRKIEPSDGSKHYIITQIGVGYRFVE